jgi:transcriptional regulator with XRE-family HTH domain
VSATSPTVSLVEEVRAFLARKRISQQAAAQHLKISQSSMSRRLAGESEFTVGEVYLLAELFEIDPSVLLSGQADA